MSNIPLSIRIAMGVISLLAIIVLTNGGEWFA